MGPSELRIGLVVEDLRFLDFLSPAIAKLGGGSGRGWDVVRRERVRGCRPRVLVDLCDRIDPDCDLLVVAADASGPAHAARAVSRRQKEAGLGPLLDRFDAKLLLAVAEPCVEAWLMADARGFSAGLENALGCKFAMPEHWPSPRREREAKEALGRLIRDGIGAVLPRLGFEFSEAIVARSELERSSNPSLAAWARGFVQAISAR